MLRPSLSAVPRSLFTAFALVCSVFALAALWTILPGAVSQMSSYIPRLIHDHQLETVLLNTAELFALSVGLQVLICVVATRLATSAPPSFMAMLLVPFATGVVAPAFAFSVLLSTGVGPFNIPLADSIWSQRVVIAVIDTWQWVGVLLVAVFFQLNQIPRSYFQLADLEGLRPWRRWRLIIWPQVRIILLFYTVFRALDWLRKVDVVNAIYGRGSGGALQTIGMYIEQLRFQSGSTFSGTAIGLQDAYSDFLALLQLVLLVTAAIYISRRRLANKLYSAGRLEQRDSEKAYVQPPRRYIGLCLFWFAISAFTIVPLLWVASLSAQNVDLTGVGNLRFHLIPTHFSWEAYRSIWSGNPNVFNGNAYGIRSGLAYSLELSAISAAIACIFAISAAYMFVAHLGADRLRGPIMAFTLSIFFFPPVIAYPSFGTLSEWSRWFSIPSMQLIFLYCSNAFVLAFILLLVRCMTIPRTHFEQTLLETRSRARAFYKTYLRYELGALFFIGTLAFSSAWSEFYVSSFVTSAEDSKPFSVVLEMNHTQYNAYYSLFAAGAILSLIVCVVPPAAIVGIASIATAWRHRRRARALHKHNSGGASMSPDSFARSEPAPTHSRPTSAR